jgi:uncharacterized membrane protein
MNNKRAVFDLFLVSVLTLFVELVFIRWAASEVRMLAFYKNFALIAAFLGIGLGFAYRQRSPDKRLFERYFFPFLAISVILLLFFGRTALSKHSAGCAILCHPNAPFFSDHGTLHPSW